MAFGRIIFTAVMAAGLVGAPRVAAEPAITVCSLRAAAEGTCDEAALARRQDPASPAPPAPTPTKQRDSLKNGALIGGAIGLGLGLIGSGIADCPGDDPSGACPAARIDGVVLSTAILGGNWRGCRRPRRGSFERRRAARHARAWPQPSAPAAAIARNDPAVVSDLGR